jgi:hypothetical protein
MATPMSPASEPPPGTLWMSTSTRILELDATPAPTQASPPVPFLDETPPSVDTTLSQLKILHAWLLKTAKAELSLGESAPLDAEDTWWKTYPPPPELLLLSGDESDEVQQVVEHLQDGIFHTPPETPDPPGLEVVEEEEITNTRPEISEHSPSVGRESELVVAKPGNDRGAVRNRLSVLQLRQPSVTSSRSSGSANSTSLSSPTSRAGRKRILPTQRTVKHGIATAGVLLYSPYYTASMPNTARPEIPQLVSPRAEAIKKYLKSRKEKRYVSPACCCFFASVAKLHVGSECASCLEDHRVKTLTTLPCQHKYCVPCLRTLIKYIQTLRALRCNPAC